MNISTYTHENLNACLSVFDSNKPKFFHEDERPVFINFLCNRPPELYYVLRLENRLVACGGIYEEDNAIAGLSWGMVHRDYHGKGIGKYLTQYRIAKLQAIYPLHRFKIETSQHTFEFYRKMGFIESYRIKDGFGLGLDKIVMWQE